MKTFHVELFNSLWSVRTGKIRISYPAWNKRVAISYAKAEAKKVEGKIVIHNHNGSTEEICYEKKG